MSTPQAVREASVRSRATGSFLERNGERYYRISDSDSLPSFLMSIVSDSDHWFFISSNGALTCGRRSPDHALFPYYTDDRIHDSFQNTGGRTVFRVQRHDEIHLWEPFASFRSGHGILRSIYKNFCGNRVVFEETNEQLGLKFSCEWMNSARFGFIRRSSLENLTSKPIDVNLLDGIQNVLPSGVSRRFQLEYSTLVDGYKRTELDLATGVALFRLTSIPVDRAEPSESLRVNVAWSYGLEGATRVLSSAQLENFRAGEQLHSETDVHGHRGAYFLSKEIRVAPNRAQSWAIVADVDQDAAQVRSLLKFLQSDKTAGLAVEEDIERGTQNLLRLVCNADGLQLTKDEAACWHHFSSTLFNAMRGGVPEHDYWVRCSDFQQFVRSANLRLASTFSSWLEALPEELLLNDLQQRATDLGDPDLERLAHEYLPLTFSRRHGDPSRPWNSFEIRLNDQQGQRVVHYEGNWRDIFQNWEALSLSFPGLTRSMLFKFLDSSTADGYNPYRISNAGYEWELLDPHDSWSYIGYWGDHQVIYLLKLLERAEKHDPKGLRGLLTRRVFTFADVPYRIRSYEEMLRDPRNTIEFDRESHRRTMARVSALGHDGRALHTRSAEDLARATLAEKLLIVILSKLSNYVPGAGIWLNTQRPEWNDANNALVGVGASVVTLCQLRRLLTFSIDLFSSSGASTAEISAELVLFFADISQALNLSAKASPSDSERKRTLDMLGKAASSYRSALYGSGYTGKRKSISVEDVVAFLKTARDHVDHAIRSNRRNDGLYHSYNLLLFKKEAIGIRRLSEMLEGQVAVLECGILDSPEALKLLEALSRSRLYRPDQQSYMLYPSTSLPRFLERNNLPARDVAQSRLLTALLEKGDSSIVVRDCDGGVHFNADLRNASVLHERLSALRGSDLVDQADAEERQVLDLYEKVFDHQSFTGRSGTLYKYEGLGCIYWHMVAKLLLAVQNVIHEAESQNAGKNVIAALKSHYEAIRSGLGTYKTPSEFGAFPFDPHSHTPDFAGAQQPGMSGQAKEDFLSRMGEMGIQLRAGVLTFTRELLAANEFLTRPAIFTYWDSSGERRAMQLPAQSMAFTMCQVPIVLHKAGPVRIEAVLSDGTTQMLSGLSLSPQVTAMVLERSGQVRAINVFLQLNDIQ